MAEEKVRILGIAGSLRRDSYNKALLRAAQELAPPDMEIEAFEGLEAIPLYNEDVRQQGFPEVVERLRQGIKSADGLLLVTPEYNYSIPGVLKNAIDWASRPPEQPFQGKVVALMGASPARTGTVRAQYHLRQCFVFLNAVVVNQPEVFVANAPQMFKEGRLADEDTRTIVGKLLQSLAQAARDQELIMAARQG